MNEDKTLQYSKQILNPGKNADFVLLGTPRGRSPQNASDNDYLVLIISYKIQ